PVKPSRVSDEDGSILGRRGGSRCPAFSRRQEERWCGRRDSPPVSKGSALRGMVPSPAPKRDRGDPQAFRLRSEGLDDGVLCPSPRKGSIQTHAAGAMLLFIGISVSSRMIMSTFRGD